MGRPAFLRLPGWLCESCWLLGVFLTGLGARLWLIQRFGTPLPFWDQWEEARVVYLPYLEGKLTLADLLSAHNEHRILFTRLYGLALLLLNGQWDNRLQMVANAVLHCATVTGLGWLMCRWIERRYWPMIWLPLLLVLALPFSWENSLAGFQSQFYFLLVFSLLTVWLLGLYPAGSTRWWIGFGCAVLCLFTVASGFLAAAAVFTLVVLRAWQRPQIVRRELWTAAVCLLVVGAGLLLKADVPHHHLLQAHSVGEFLFAFADCLAWPWIVIPMFALVNLAPLAVLAWCFWRSKQRGSAEELTLALGIWTVLQSAAAAYARGAEGRPPGWRYMDSICFILIVNCFSMAILLQNYFKTGLAGEFSGKGLAKPGGQRHGSVFRQIARRVAGSFRSLLVTAFALWAVAMVLGLALLTSRAWRIDIPERAFFQRAQLQLARAFVATDNIHVFDGKPRSYLISYQGDPLAPPLEYEAKWTVDYLRDGRVQKLLPACARPALKVEPDPAATERFQRRGFRLAAREPATEVSWGSWTEGGPAAMGEFQSQALSSSGLPFLEIEVAGDLGEAGLSLELVDLVTGRRTEVLPPNKAGGRWEACFVRAPAGAFRIIARDASRTGWFAFKAPREVGRLSFWAVVMLRIWPGVLLVGMALLGFSLAGFCKRLAQRCPE